MEKMILNSKPKIKRKFTKTKVLTNLYDVRINNEVNAYRYDLKASPTNDQSSIESLVRRAKDHLGDIFSSFQVSGKMLYSFARPQPVACKHYSIDLETGTIGFRLPNENMDGGFQELSLTPVGQALQLAQLADPNIEHEKKAEHLQALNVYLGGQMEAMRYCQLGYSGKYFERSFLGTSVRRVQVVPGFKVGLGVYERSRPKMMVDWVCRIIREDSLWQEWSKAKNKNVAKDQILGSSYLNLLTGKLVRVSGIEDKKKLNLQSNHPDPRFRSYLDFFSMKFEIEERRIDPKQFLVFSYKKTPRNKPTKDGKHQVIEMEENSGKKSQKKEKKKEEREKEYFLPQFLQPTGLTDRMKTDEKMMRDIAKFTAIWPDKREERQKSMLLDLKSQFTRPTNRVIDGVIDDSNYTEAITLEKPRIYFRKNSLTPGPKGNFFLKGKTRETYNFKKNKWAIIWEGDIGFAEDAADEMYNACERLGIQMDWATMIELPGTRPTFKDVRRACQEALDSGAEMVVFIMDEYSQKNNYKLFKQIFNQKYGLLSQGLRFNKEILRKKLCRGVFDKLAVQMATKMGIAPWIVQKPLDLPKENHGVMLVGADVFHSRGKDSVAAVVGTTDNDFSKYTSFSSIQPKRGQEIMTNVAKMVLSCVQEYTKKNNNKVPSLVMFYRDGVGRGQQKIVEKEEIHLIKQGLQEKYGKKAPKLVFILVTKRINNRFYKIDKRKGRIGNPDSGLIVHSDVVSDDKFDFFMVAQNVNQGTATPTHYEVLLNESSFSADFFFTMTFYQTFNYYNWSGPVKVPAVCQCAHKQAYLLGETHMRSTHSGLKSNLFYL